MFGRKRRFLDRKKGCGTTVKTRISALMAASERHEVENAEPIRRANVVIILLVCLLKAEKWIPRAECSYTPLAVQEVHLGGGCTGGTKR